MTCGIGPTPDGSDQREHLLFLIDCYGYARAQYRHMGHPTAHWKDLIDQALTIYARQVADAEIDALASREGEEHGP